MDGNAFNDPKTAAVMQKFRQDGYEAMEKDSKFIAHKITDLKNGEPKLEILINEKYRDTTDATAKVIVFICMAQELVKAYFYTRAFVQGGPVAYNQLVETGVDILSEEFRDVSERVATNLEMRKCDLYTREMFEKWINGKH